MWKLVRLGTVSVNRKIRKNHSFATESFLVRCHGLSLFYPYIRREKKKREEGWKERFELIRRTKGLQSCLFFFSITRNANFINIALVTGPRPAANEPNPELFVSKFSFSKEQNRPPCCVRFNSPRINPVWISSCFFFFFFFVTPPLTTAYHHVCSSLFEYRVRLAGICAVREIRSCQFDPCLRSDDRCIYTFVYIERDRNQRKLRMKREKKLDRGRAIS